MKGANGVSSPRELKLRRSIEPPPPELSSGDGDGEVRPQHKSFSVWASLEILVG